ncbi:MAG TPA: MFS transporter [Mycobacteriales bacterium]
MDAAVSSTGTARETGLAFFRPFLPLFGTIFFCLLSVGASLATLPFYVTEELGGGNLAVGFVVATIAVAAIVARPIAGRLADSRGYKPIFLAGALACSAAGVLSSCPCTWPCWCRSGWCTGSARPRSTRPGRPGWWRSARRPGAAGWSASTAPRCGSASRSGRWPGSCCGTGSASARSGCSAS